MSQERDALVRTYLEKYKDPANDSSHAGPASHLKAAELIYETFMN